MVIKNKENEIADMLSHHEDLIDEIIILDTGSTDKTKEKVKAFSKAKLIDFSWQDDFAKARNESIKHATKDWILFLRPNEKIPKEHFKIVQKIVKQKKVKACAFQIKQGDLQSPIPQVRLFQNNQNISFSYQVYEAIEPYLIEHSIPIAFLPAIIEQKVREKTQEEHTQKNAYYKKLLDEELKKIPKDPKPWFELGTWYLAQQDLKNAISSLQQSIDVGASMPQVWDALGHAYYQSKNIEKAFENYKHAIIISGNPVLGFFNLGLFFIKEQNDSFASKAFLEALKHDAYHIGSINNLAFLHLKNNNTEKAQELLKRSIKELKDKEEYKKKILPLYYNLSILHIQKNQFSEAEDILKEALILDDTDPRTYANLIQCYIAVGKKEEAKEILKKAKEKNLESSLLQKSEEKLAKAFEKKEK